MRTVHVPLVLHYKPFSTKYMPSECWVTGSHSTFTMSSGLLFWVLYILLIQACWFSDVSLPQYMILNCWVKRCLSRICASLVMCHRHGPPTVHTSWLLLFRVPYDAVIWALGYNYEPPNVQTSCVLCYYSDLYM